MCCGKPKSSISGPKARLTHLFGNSAMKAHKPIAPNNHPSIQSLRNNTHITDNKPPEMHAPHWQNLWKRFMILFVLINAPA